jgi:hypothetical protein
MDVLCSIRSTARGGAATNRLFFATIALLAVGALLAMPSPTQSTHSTSTVDRVSIDMDEAGNGVPAVGDRDGDTVPDAEGFPVLVCGALPVFAGDGRDDDLDGTADDGCPGAPASVGTPEQGVCGNGIDDDRTDINGSTMIGDYPAEVDGSADDGCQVTLSSRQTCAEIIDDGVLNADEDIVDKVFVDITVGAQPGPAGGIPLDRPLTAFSFQVKWDLLSGASDVLNITAFSPYFLIVSRGNHPDGPFAVISEPSPNASPYYLGVSTGGEIVGYPSLATGPGVLARLTFEGHNAGLSRIAYDLASNPPLLLDDQNEFIPTTTVNDAFLAVSRDGPDAGATIGDSANELFTCVDSDGDGIVDVGDSCPNEPEDFDGFEDEDGCLDSDVDSDGDGFLDHRDACPQDPGVFERMGCPVPAVGGIAGLLDGAAAEPGAARVPSEDERGDHALTFALAGISAALLAASGIAVSLRRRL